MFGLHFADGLYVQYDLVIQRRFAGAGLGYLYFRFFLFFSYSNQKIYECYNVLRLSCFPRTVGGVCRIFFFVFYNLNCPGTFGKQYTNGAPAVSTNVNVVVVIFPYPFAGKKTKSFARTDSDIWRFKSAFRSFSPFVIAWFACRNLKFCYPSTNTPPRTRFEASSPLMKCHGK